MIESSGTSLFFTNFPDDWTRRSMWIHFQRFGSVLDIFIPTKRSKQGMKFGFVKFKDIKNLEVLLAQIKGVPIGAEYLHVNEARCGRNARKPHHYTGRKVEARILGATSIHALQEVTRHAHTTTATNAWGCPLEDRNQPLWRSSRLSPDLRSCTGYLLVLLSK